MNYKNLKRCIHSPKFFRFVMPVTAGVCSSYEKLESELNNLLEFHLKRSEKATIKLDKEANKVFAKELEEALKITEKLKKV